MNDVELLVRNGYKLYIHLGEKFYSKTGDGNSACGDTSLLLHVMALARADAEKKTAKKIFAWIELGKREISHDDKSGHYYILLSEDLQKKKQEMGC